ncbi:hypothetical protein EUX98_g3925 [Antrodiella citrinella]|uniref:Fungal-type protein kinase domain-containing protein n=1 Tax=Antrodiella citrinella TaxID=2447956 RepID=A0A4S4MVC4_9APHY|nr:hypothetical protein EUX98_g3925 [Antrodiella citrinella]
MGAPSASQVLQTNKPDDSEDHLASGEKPTRPQVAMHSLNTVKDARKLISVLRDIVIALIHLWSRKGTHRDVALWSMAMDKDGKGILLDLDMGFHNTSCFVPSCEMGYYRSGSFSFRAVSLARHPYNYYEAYYDLESLFWVFSLLSLCTFENDTYGGYGGRYRISNELSAVDNWRYTHSSVPVSTSVHYGTEAKDNILANAIEFDVHPLGKLFDDLRKLFYQLRLAYKAHRYEGGISAQIAYTTLKYESESSTNNAVLRLFEEALASDRWSDEEPELVN